MSMVHSPSAHTQPGAAKTVADILTAAADLIEPEGRWKQGAFERDASGRVRSLGSPSSVCFCGVGAVYRAGAGQPGSITRALDIADRVARRKRDTYEAFTDFNDAGGRTQAEVVAALRAAAERARTATEGPSVGMSEANAPIPPVKTGEG